MTVSKFQRVMDYSGAFTSDDYALDDGHGWDRLAAIAGEHERGEIDWPTAMRLCDENAADVRRGAAAARVSDGGDCDACALMSPEDREAAGWSCDVCGVESAHGEGVHTVQHGIFHEFVCRGCDGGAE